MYSFSGGVGDYVQRSPFSVARLAQVADSFSFPLEILPSNGRRWGPADAPLRLALLIWSVSYITALLFVFWVLSV